MLNQSRSFESSLHLINDASTATPSSLFIRYRLKIVRALSQISFLSTCIHFRSCSKFIAFRLYAPWNSITMRVSEDITKKWRTNREKTSSRLRLATLLDPDDYDDHLRFCASKKLSLASALRKNKLKKLKLLTQMPPASAPATRFSTKLKNSKLITQGPPESTSASRPRSSDPNSHQFADSFMNLSNVQFTTEELDLLRKRKKFGLPQVFKTKQLKSILVADIASDVGNNDHRVNLVALNSLVNDVPRAISNSSLPYLSLVRSISSKLKCRTVFW